MSFTKKCGAEAFGTFALIFAGTGAIIINDVSGGAVTHVGVALTFGLIVLAMIYAVGDVSGAHLNPAVTIGFFAARRFRGKSVLPYIVSQSLGALAASVLIRTGVGLSTFFRTLDLSRCADCWRFARGGRVPMRA